MSNHHSRLYDLPFVPRRTIHVKFQQSTIIPSPLSRLESLPSEIKLMILHNIPTFADLRNLVWASHIYYQCYLLEAEDIHISISLRESVDWINGKPSSPSSFPDDVKVGSTGSNLFISQPMGFRGASHSMRATREIKISKASFAVLRTKHRRRVP